MKYPRLTLGFITLFALSGCAVGTGGDSLADIRYDPDAELSGNLSVMGFGAGDEVAEARVELTKKALGSDVDVNLIEGDLDLQQFLSSVASGNPPVVLNRSSTPTGSAVSGTGRSSSPQASSRRSR